MEIKTVSSQRLWQDNGLEGCMGTWPSGRFSMARLTVGLANLGDVLQPKRFHDSMFK